MAVNIKGDAKPYQLALKAWNKFRGYESKGKTNFERIQEAGLKKDFVKCLTGDAYVMAQREWEAEYQELINEDNRLCFYSEVIFDMDGKFIKQAFYE